MALAESDHHAAPRGQKMARAGREEREENYEPRLLDPPLPQTAATVGYVAAVGPLLVFAVDDGSRQHRRLHPRVPPRALTGDEEGVGGGGEEEARGEGKGEGAEGGQGHGRLLLFSLGTTSRGRAVPRRGRRRSGGGRTKRGGERSCRKPPRLVFFLQLALGNPDFLRAFGFWLPLVRCRSRPRSTGKFGVFWETNS